MVHRLLFAAAVATAVALCGPASAQPGGKDQPKIEAQVERLQRQLRELEQSLDQTKPSARATKGEEGERKKGEGKKGEAKKGEGLRMTLAALSSSQGRQAAELDQTRLVLVERRAKLRQPILEVH